MYQLKNIQTHSFEIDLQVVPFGYYNHSLCFHDKKTKMLSKKFFAKNKIVSFPVFIVEVTKCPNTKGSLLSAEQCAYYLDGLHTIYVFCR